MIRAGKQWSKRKGGLVPGEGAVWKNVLLFHSVLPPPHPLETRPANSLQIPTSSPVVINGRVEPGMSPAAIIIVIMANLYTKRLRWTSALSQGIGCHLIYCSD